jgi:peptidylprolyl isomerase
VVGLVRAETPESLAPVEETVDYVVAAVNGEAITRSALDMAVRDRGSPLDDARARREVLESLIDRRLFLQAARTYIVIADAAVEARVRAREMRYPSRERWLDELARRGMAVEDVREQAREELALLQFVQREFRPKINEPSAADVEAYYMEHRVEFAAPASYRVETVGIAIPPEAYGNPAALAALRAHADAVHARLSSGEASFETFAGEGTGRVTATSASGESGAFIPELRPLLATMEVGVWHEPITAPLGFLLVRLVERTGPTPRALADVREDVQRTIEAERVQAVMDAWLREQRARADVRILDGVLRAVSLADGALRAP